MYNRYLTAAQQQRPPEPPAETQPVFSGQEEPLKEPAAQVSGCSVRSHSRLSGFRIDADTLVVLAVVWFVLNDKDEEMDTELLIVLGVLLLLGI